MSAPQSAKALATITSGASGASGATPISSASIPSSVDSPPHASSTLRTSSTSGAPNAPCPSAAFDPVSDLTTAEGLADAIGFARDELSSVRVASVESSERTSLTFLDVAYAGSAAARATLPTRLVLKQKLPGPPGAKPPRALELDFYARIAPSLPSPPVVRCLGARAPSAMSPGFVVLEDLRATHAEPADDEIDVAPAVDALARLHAAKWESADRPTWPRGNPTEQSIRAATQWIAARLPAFFDAAGNALDASERRLYQRVFSFASSVSSAPSSASSAPTRPWLRLLDGRAQTLIHGDAHIGNCLFPRDPRGDAYLIDWDRWQADVGARDLAFMMLHWRPQKRWQHEETLLRRYLAQLEAHGVRGYAWDDLWNDYRSCWIRNLTIPVTRQAEGRPEESWRDALECTIAAVIDLGGEALL